MTEGDARPILIAGPTASGKSSLALALAEQLNGVVLNADALQVYAEWRVLTARPSPEDAARAPHRLYGHVPAADAGYSTGRWLRETAATLKELRDEGRQAILVGGTGLYFKALTQGLAEIPPTPPDIRAAVEERLASAGAAALVEELQRRDPASAAAIDLANPRRVLRAIEILDSTGTGRAAWIARTPPPLLPLALARPLRITPPRADLRAVIARRFRAMIERGALDEARAMTALESSGAIPPAAPALKALGYAPLRAHLEGATSLDDAIAASVVDTNQYAKRQSTWLRNQMAAWPEITATGPDALRAALRCLGL